MEEEVAAVTASSAEEYDQLKVYTRLKLLLPAGLGCGSSSCICVARQAPPPHTIRRHQQVTTPFLRLDLSALPVLLALIASLVAVCLVCLTTVCRG